MVRALLIIGGLLALAVPQPAAAPSRDPAIYGHINHLGWIVKDLDAVTRAWRNFGVTGIQDAGTVEIPMTQRGEAGNVRVRRATAQIGSLAIHWIQPLGSSDVFTSFLTTHGEGVHHIAFEVPSSERLDEEVRSLAAAGIAPALEGGLSTPAGDVRFVYLDTATAGGGITVELEYNPATARASATPTVPHEEPFNRVTQVAFVVRNLEAVSAYWARAGFGAIPFDRNVTLDRVYRAQPGRFEMLLGFARTADVPFEWIQPLVGPSVYEEYVAAHGEGVHHLGFNVVDFDASVARLGERDLNVTMSGRWDTRGSQGRFAYLDAERFGGVAIELLWNKPASAQADTATALSKGAQREFLLKAKIIKHKALSKGVTRPQRLTLTDGTLTHDAVFSAFRETTPIMRFPSGRTELDFVDSYAYNIAAYRVAELLGLDAMMPMTVEREYEHQKGSLVWWVDAKLDEGDRRTQKLLAPDREDWNRQMSRMHVFTQLIADTDRNTGNILIDADWKIWMIDFTRAFRRNRTPAAEADLQRCDRNLLSKLRELTRDGVAAAAKPYIGGAEIDALIARRDAIVARFDKLIAERGEARVLY